MDHWKALQEAGLRGSFGKEKIYLGTVAIRPHSSISSIREHSKEIEPNQVLAERYDPLALRYVVAKNIADDMFVSLYNVNSFEIVAFRISKQLQKNEEESIIKSIGRMKRPNIEIRAIGLLNGGAEMLRVIETLHTVSRGSLVEADLFGDEYRHIAIDLKTGASYDLLLEDRLYRPGELKIQDIAKQAPQNNAAATPPAQKS